MKRWFSIKAEQRISANNGCTWPTSQRYCAHQSRLLDPWQSYTTSPSPALQELPVCPTQTTLAPASLWTKRSQEHQLSVQPTSNKHAESFLPPRKWGRCSAGLSVTSRARLPRFQFDYSPVRPWVIDLFMLGLSFLIWKMILLVPTLKTLLW